MEQGSWVSVKIPFRVQNQVPTGQVLRERERDEAAGGLFGTGHNQCQTVEVQKKEEIPQQHTHHTSVAVLVICSLQEKSLKGMDNTIQSTVASAGGAV